MTTFVGQAPLLGDYAPAPKGVHPKLVQELLGYADIAATHARTSYPHGGRTASAMEYLLEDFEE